MLTADEQAEVFDVLRDSPLIANWPAYATEYLPRLSLRTYRPGELIYKPGDSPLNLFILVEGQVTQAAHHEGRAWFLREVKPGEYFGQHALFTYEYRSTAEAGPSGARVALMPAADLRVGLEQDPGLREVLLREQLASRMRRLPLLRELTDDEMRWLALVVEDLTFQQGESVPVDSKPGVWLIDRGQVAVTGPANPYPEEWEVWRLTSGNFFVAPRGEEPGARGLIVLDGMRHGTNCAADTAVAYLPAQLIFVPADHASRLADGMPEVAALLQRPLDIPAYLRVAPLFRDLSERHLQHLAQFTGWEFVPAGQNVTTQGNPGRTYIILREGATAVVAYDEQGRERPRNKLLPVSAYGATSLLEGKVRDATVRAVKGDDIAGADVLTLDRSDLRYAFREDPALWTRDQPLVTRSVKDKEKQAPLPWMQEGEVLVFKDRPHWFWLAGPLVMLALIVLVLLLGVAALPADLSGTATMVVLGVFIVVFAPVALIIFINYHDDYYAVTNRRVTRRDRQLILYEARQEAPIEMIQDVTVMNGFWGRVFDFGDLTVRTASKASAIRFEKVPHPDAARELIEAARTEARAAVRGRRREDLRRGLISGLQLALAVPQRSRALGDVPLPPAPVARQFSDIFRRGPSKPPSIPVRPSTRPVLERLTRNLPPETRYRILGPEKKGPTPVSTEFVWRKHWFNLVLRAGIPFLLLIILLVLGAVWLLEQPTLFSFTPAELVLVYFGLLAVDSFALWWQYVDYKNDVYVVTDDRIIDVEMKPLGLSEKRREGPLDRVQNVFAQQRGILAAIFQYGDVIITTAAADEGFTFNMVPNPKLVQSIIFQKLDAFRSRQEEKHAADRQREIIEGLEVYHQLRGGREAPPEWRES